MNKENETIIRALNKYSKVPENWELLNQIEQLEQENKQLKERVEYLERSNNRREDTILGLRQELIDSEEKIDKTIEYIEESLNIIDNEVMIESKNIKNYYLLPLLQILKGENNE